MHNLNTYTYPAHPGRWHDQFEVRSDFPLCVHFADFNVFNAFNGLVLVFFNGLKSKGLENLTDQRLTEVTFVATVNV